MSAGATQLDGCNPRRRKGVCNEDVALTKASDHLIDRLRAALRQSGSTVDGIELERLADWIERSIRRRDALHRVWTKDRLATDDILRAILDARDRGDRDEALWLAFLAAHFGRESADRNVEGEVESSYRFLCAFGSARKWTWTAVSRGPQALRRWLADLGYDLRRLSYGNHRKFEAKKPHVLWEVIESFLALAAAHGGSPSTLFDADAGLTPQQRFGLLYRRLKTLRRFGRTGRFDLLVLLGDMGLLEVEPDSCYIAGSTGPKEGARRLWGREKMPRQLGRLADELAGKLRLSPLVIEDALCNWQK